MPFVVHRRLPIDRPVRSLQRVLWMMPVFLEMEPPNTA